MARIGEMSESMYETASVSSPLMIDCSSASSITSGAATSTDRGRLFVSIRSPLNFCRPERCAHLTLSDVFRVARLKRFIARRALGRTFDALLAEANQLDLIARFRQHRVGLGGMAGRALGLVIA
ncbi:MAG: hypothetical protein ACK55Z_23585, partial [bacterium]